MQAGQRATKAALFLPFRRWRTAGCAAPLPRFGSWFSTADSSVQQGKETITGTEPNGMLVFVPSCLLVHPSSRWHARVVGQWCGARKERCCARCEATVTLQPSEPAWTQRHHNILYQTIYLVSGQEGFFYHTACTFHLWTIAFWKTWWKTVV